MKSLFGVMQLETAEPYLAEALTDCVINQLHITIGIVHLCMERHTYAEAHGVLQWTLESLRLMQDPQQADFYGKMRAWLLVMRGELYLLERKKALAAASVRQARDLAKAFDAAPCYALHANRFLDLPRLPLKIAVDDLGETAMQALR